MVSVPKSQQVEPQHLPNIHNQLSNKFNIHAACHNFSDIFNITVASLFHSLVINRINDAAQDTCTRTARWNKGFN